MTTEPPPGWDKQSWLGSRWDTLRTPIYLILDETGANVADACIRPNEDAWAPPGTELWLYSDNVDGYSFLTDREVGYLHLVLT